MMKNVPEIRELTDEEIDCVAGGVSDDALYGAAIGLAVASVGALIAVPTMGTSTTLCVWGPPSPRRRSPTTSRPSSAA